MPRKTWFTQYLISPYRFIQFVLRHFIEDDCGYVASSLAFTSLLAVVPLMSVGLAIFSTFPVFRELADPVQNFIFENFVPATGKIVQSYLLQFTAQVSKLSLFGILFLIVTALLLLVTIERAMNRIWRVASARQGVKAFLLYWAILSLAPIILGLSIAATSYLFSLPMIAHHPPPSFFLHYSPFLLSLIGFTFLYTVVPNCPVQIINAFWGGLFAALLFETAKQGFAYYLIHFNTYELLYGAFAIVPIFFVWVYWVWFITLLGAEISYALSVHHQRRVGQPIDGFTHALLWLYELWLAQQKGIGVRFKTLIKVSNKPFSIDAHEMLRILIDHQFIHATEKDEYILGRDLNHLSIYDLTQILPFHVPTQKDLVGAKSENYNWIVKFIQIDKQLNDILNISLEELFENNPQGTPTKK